MPLFSKPTLRTKVLLLILGCTLSLSAFVPKVWQEDLFLSKLLSRLTTFRSNYPQEKVYLHLDKPYYAAGDNIWFKAYLVQADSHTPSSSSRVLYVELITPDDNIYKTVVVKMDKGLGRGDFALPDEIPDGLYRIRAYTSWMQNFDQDYFYHQNVQVWNPRRNDVLSTVDFSFKRQSNGDSVIAKLQLLNYQQKPYANTAFSYTTEVGRKAQEYKAKTDAAGNSRLRFFIQDGDARKNARLQLNVPQGENGEITKTYAIPLEADKIDLQFFPEGGNLVAGLWNNIAFKAVDGNGLSKEVQGAIYDQTGQKVIDFKSLKFGMGRTGFIPDPSKQYIARLIAPSGNKTEYPLPKPQARGFILSVDNIRMPEKVRVKFYSLGFASAPEAKPASVYLIAQARGQVFFSAKAANDREVFQVEIPSIKLPTGIVQFTMFSDKGVPLAERLVFVNNNQQLKLSVTSDKPIYKPREKVTLRVQAKDETGKAVAGSFSMAVTDLQNVTPAPNAANIVSYLLMSSDLRGHIENPSYYFNTKTPEAALALDNLMLTQGWRRFIWTDLLQDKYPQLTYKAERTLAINGTVKRINGQLEPYSPVSLVDLKTGLFQSYTADDKGQFSFDLRSYTDSAKLVVKSGDGKTAGNSMIVIDDNLPQARVIPRIPYATYTVPLTKDTWAYLRRNREQFSLDKFSGKGTTLNAVTIVGTRQTEEEQKRASMRKSSLYLNADATITGAQLPPSMNIIQSLQGRVAGLQVSNGQVTMRGGGAATFLLDGVPVDAQMVQSINPNDVEFIDVLKPGASSAIYGSQGGNGIVAVYTKRGERSSSSSSSNTNQPNAIGMAIYKGLYYQTPRQFYVPRYDKPDPKTAELPDLRTTLYWNPTIQTDTAGVAEMTFYTADQKTNYRIVLEGLTPQGDVGYSTGSFQVR